MSTYDIVEEVLEENEKAREDDFMLCIRVYLKLGFAKRSPHGITIYFENIEEAPSFETITRIRRTIQNTEERLKPNQEVQEKRDVYRKEIIHRYASKYSRAETFPGSQLMS